MNHRYLFIVDSFITEHEIRNILQQIERDIKFDYNIVEVGCHLNDSRNGVIVIDGQEDAYFDFKTRVVRDVTLPNGVEIVRNPRYLFNVIMLQSLIGKYNYDKVFYLHNVSKDLVEIPLWYTIDAAKVHIDKEIEIIQLPSTTEMIDGVEITLPNFLDPEREHQVRSLLLALNPPNDNLLDCKEDVK